MNSKINSKIDLKIQNGYTLETGSLIDESVNTFKKTFLISGVAVILLAIFTILIYGTILVLIYGLSDFTSTMTEFQASQTSAVGMLSTVIIATVTGAFFAPITAGFIHANHLAKNNQEIGINVFFDFYKSTFFKDLFLSHLIIGLTGGLLSSCLTLINLQILTYFIQLFISVVTVFTIPLIIYGEQNYENALTKSFKLFLKQPLLVFVALLLAIIGVFIGIIALCIGIIFTAPYYYSMVYAIYNQAIGFEEKSVIDEIGQKEF